jgi:hypothetical protein
MAVGPFPSHIEWMNNKNSSVVICAKFSIRQTLLEYKITNTKVAKCFRNAESNSENNSLQNILICALVTNNLLDFCFSM